MKLGDRIKNARLAADLTQEQLAEKLGTDRLRIIDWEKGHHAPSDKYQRRLALFFDADADYFAPPVDEHPELVRARQVYLDLVARYAS